MSSATSVNPHSSNPASSKTTFAGFHISPLLSWQDPSKTGLLLLQALGLFAVFSSPLTLRLFFRLAASIVGAASAIEWGSRAISGQSKGLVSSYQPSRFLPFSEKFVHNISNYVASLVSKVTFGIQHLIDARNPIKGLKLAVVLYAAYILLGIFSLRVLVLSTIILAFSLPPLYLQFKPEVDRTITDLQTQFQEYRRLAWQKVHEKAGPQIDFLKKLAPKAPAVTENTATSKVPASSTETSAHFTTAESNAPHVAAVATEPTTVGAVPVPEDIRAFDSVPTLAGNIPINHEKLAADLAADRAKAEGAVNGL